MSKIKVDGKWYEEVAPRVPEIIVKQAHRDRVVESVRQILALAVADGKPYTTRDAAIVCERALATLE